MFKKILYGDIPFFLLTLVKSSSANLKYYKYIKEHGYARHLYLFANEYLNKDIEVYKDKQKDLYYVLFESKRLYFRRDFSEEKIMKLYCSLLMEQDIRSPHHYIDSVNEISSDVFIDIGCAEGILSLCLINKVEHIYLFECDELWIEALEATFEPWRDKVTIVRKYVSNVDRNDEMTLDKFFKEQHHQSLFLKMDVEGYERKVLDGCKMLFKNNPKVDFAICTYHLSDDEKIISGFLDRYNCKYINRRGFFRHKLRSVVIRGCNY